MPLGISKLRDQEFLCKVVLELDRLARNYTYQAVTLSDGSIRSVSTSVINYEVTRLVDIQ